MLKQRAKVVAGGLRAVDMAVLAAAFPIAYYLRDTVLLAEGAVARHGGLYPISTYWPLLAATVLLWQLASWSSGLYAKYRTLSIRTEIRRIARAIVVMALVVAAGQFVSKQQVLSRLFVGLYYSTVFVLLVANRVALRLVARAARRRGRNIRTFAVAGSGDMAEMAVEAIGAHREWGYAFAGYILEDGAKAPPGAKVLGRLSEMGHLLESHVLDEVIFSASREQLDGIDEAISLCEEQGVGVRVLLDFLVSNRSSRATVEELEGIPMLSFSRTPSDVAPLVGKRIFDVVVSATALVLLAPLFLGIAIAIKLDSPGPVLFRQRRIGLNGRDFWLYKFRSMCHDAEAKLVHVKDRNEMDGPAFKILEDPRVTRVGRFLRKTSLDEAPQFWNVLKGEMSVVGPRPPIRSEVKLYKRWQRRRLSVKPGITCTWQASGRNEIDFAQWMELDLHYIDNWSLWHDLKIVLRTIPAVILGKGAR
jgi:exopolysaccharide biosynthesis polyprenyl glycosylphosphotransferase